MKPAKPKIATRICVTPVRESLLAYISRPPGRASSGAFQPPFSLQEMHDLVAKQRDDRDLEHMPDESVDPLLISKIRFDQPRIGELILVHSEFNRGLQHLHS